LTTKRLIEEDFPLKKVSLDSKHEKNVRHGHISTLHIWPARRPLAACRAAIIAALLPDPGDEEERRELLSEIESITRWGTESGPKLEKIRARIRQAYGGRAPRLLDMFAGGGAIPLEAMRLGCEVIANDYNPVAWFILKCTLEFPQRLAGQRWPLPNLGIDAALTASLDDEDDEAVPDEDESRPEVQMGLPDFEAETRYGDLADHVRLWGAWVLTRAREELQDFYPVVNGQPTVAYLWARTVPCPDPACNSEVPLLKTLWLSTKAEKTLPDTPENRAHPDFLRLKTTKKTSRVVINARRALRLIPDKANRRVRFEVWTPGPNDEVSEGTMAGAKSRCPCCGAPVTGDYIKECGHTNRMGARMTTVVFHAGWGKEYRLPTDEDEQAAQRAIEVLPAAAVQIPHGLPNKEPLPKSGTSGAGRAFTIPQYGFKTWADLFTHRQLLALVTFVKLTRAARDEMQKLGYDDTWNEAVSGYLAMLVDRVSGRGSTLCTWTVGWDKIGHTFARYALQITWDFAESVPIARSSGGYPGEIEWVARYIEHAARAANDASVFVGRQSATLPISQTVHAIITDPPYYDAIPYADISDFFYVWLRRTVGDIYPAFFSDSLTPKADELVQQTRSAEVGQHGKAEYEQGMATAFQQASKTLVSNGRMVVVFAHKDPDAWETLVSAMIQAGFTVTASWPIDTEMQGGMRSKRASLASSVWLVCRKRPTEAGRGHYKAVQNAMRERITERLRYFWDKGISGPDFVWAAVGPALESYSAHREVRRNDGTVFTVSEFLREVRRMVADFALGQILHGRPTEGLDEWTRYYLMHRSDFGLEAAPVGECILLAGGYGLNLNDLRGPKGVFAKGTGSDMRLAKWEDRTHDELGTPMPGLGLPMIDALHRLIWLWAAGDSTRFRTYLTDTGLADNDLFWEVGQAILEMAEPKSRERNLLEAVVSAGNPKKHAQADNVGHQPSLWTEEQP
jgi:putative DNA methylase